MKMNTWLLAAALALCAPSAARAGDPPYERIEYRVDTNGLPPWTWHTYPKDRPLDFIYVEARTRSWAGVDGYGVGKQNDGPLTKALAAEVAAAVREGSWRKLPPRTPGPGPFFRMRIVTKDGIYALQGSLERTHDPLVSLLESIRQRTAPEDYEIGLPGEKVKGPPSPPGLVARTIRSMIAAVYMRLFVDGTNELVAWARETASSIRSGFERLTGRGEPAPPRPRSEGLTRILDRVAEGSSDGVDRAR